MSVVDFRGVRTPLPRRDPERFWDRLRESYCRSDRRRWRRLAMLTLREAAGWPDDRIAAAFDVDRAQVPRCLATLRRDLRRKFEAEGVEG